MGSASRARSAPPSAADTWGDLARYVPPELARRMRDAGGRVAGERRLVTVMFADLSGFTAMSEKLDPEVVASITNECLAALVEVVHRHDGTVDKFIGDEIMALFGAPIAHEDDAVRAVRAALEMMTALERFNDRHEETLPRRLAAHFGLHSGEVVAGDVGHDLRLNYTVMGDTVNLAARLADASEGGQVFCSARTRALARHVFEFRAMPALNAKGKSRPVVVWDVVGALAAPRTDDTPLVGRDDELRWLLDVVAGTARGLAGPALVRGPAGIGKSRLLRALAARVGGQVVVVRPDALQGEPYALAGRMVREVVGVATDDDAATAAARVARFLAAREVPASHHGAVAALAGISQGTADPAARAEALAEVLRRARGPLLVLVEDLHQADPSSRALLVGLAERGEPARVPLIATWRDGDHGEPPPWRSLALSPLDGAAAGALANARLAVPLPPDVRALVEQRAGGVPLFVEQLVAALVDSGWLVQVGDGWRARPGVPPPPLPEGISGLVMARVDRLDHPAREALRHAAVIGPEVPRWLVGAVAGARAERALDELVARGFLAPAEGTPPFDLRFTHAMLREAPLATVMREQRRRLHLAVADAFEARVPDAQERWGEWLLGHLEGAEAWERAEALAGRQNVRVRRAIGAVPEEVARRLESATARAADVRPPWQELLVAAVAMILPAACVVGLTVVLWLAIGDLLYVAPFLLLLAIAVPPYVWPSWPWTQARSVVIDDHAVRVHRQLGAPIVVPLADLRAVTWHARPGLRAYTLALRPSYAGSMGSAAAQLRASVVGAGQWIDLERDRGRVRLQLGRTTEVVHALRDAVAVAEGRDLPLLGTAGALERYRRVWWSPAEGGERVALRYEDLLDQVERGVIGGADLVGGDPERLEPVAVAADGDPGLRRALRPISPRALLQSPLVPLGAWSGLLYGCWPMLAWHDLFPGALAFLAVNVTCGTALAAALLMAYGVADGLRRTRMPELTRWSVAIVASTGAALALLALAAVPLWVGGVGRVGRWATWLAYPPAWHQAVAAGGASDPAAAARALEQGYAGTLGLFMVTLDGFNGLRAAGRYDAATDLVLAARQSWPESLLFAELAADAGCRAWRFEEAGPAAALILREPADPADTARRAWHARWFRDEERTHRACLARVLAEAGETSGARGELALLGDAPLPDRPFALAAGAWQLLEPDADPATWAARFPGHEAAALLALGQANRDTGSWERARQVFAAAVMAGADPSAIPVGPSRGP